MKFAVCTVQVKALVSLLHVTVRISSLRASELRHTIHGVVSCSAAVREDVCVNFRVCAGPKVHNLQTTGKLTTITSYSKLAIFSFPLSAVTVNSLPQFLSLSHPCPSLEQLARRMK
jgi:hypothetical protein